MRHSSLIHALFNSKRTGNKNLALWDKAEPISLEEIKARFASIARNEFAYKADHPVLGAEELTFEELWKIFESLEDLDDCPVV